VLLKLTKKVLLDRNLMYSHIVHRIYCYCYCYYSPCLRLL